MCIKPGLLPDGTRVACRECWQCRENRVNDWVGRCIAESKTAKAAHAITLTYGRDESGAEDHLRAKVLTYSDVQKYFKRLRRAGYPLRYFAIGEYGSLKGRAHWHLVVYWLDAVPPHELDARFDCPFWPHGVSHWTEPTPAAIRYNVKYVQKDIGKDGRQGHLMMSKKPPLGAEYFMREAERWVDAGLAPQDLIYTFDEARDKRGEKVKFHLRGKTADVFLAHFCETWKRRRPGRHLPNSELLESWADKTLAKELGDESLAKRLAYAERQEDNAKRAHAAKQDRYETVSAFEWVRASRFRRVPSDDQALPGMRWENSISCWIAPAREGHEYRVWDEQNQTWAIETWLVWHFDELKGKGQWLPVLPPDAKAA